MVQRYRVFLNERAVIITQDSDMPRFGMKYKTVEYIDKSALSKDYQHFYKDENCEYLLIYAPEKFAEACKVFNLMFKRIEAAGGIVRNQKREILFIKRLGIWDLPKGKIKKNEQHKNGALREVTEETGISDLSIVKQLPSTYHIYTDIKGKQVLKETYWFEMENSAEQNPVPQLEEDITEVKWFAESEIEIPLNNTYASLRQLLENYLLFSKVIFHTNY